MMVNWTELYKDNRKEIPDAPVWFAVLFVTYTWVVLPIVVWWDVDFRMFRFKVKIVLRKIFFRFLRGR